jgi:hypothetical protein
MPEGFPCHNLLAELLHRAISVHGMGKENTISNSRQLSSESHCLSMSL